MIARTKGIVLHRLKFSESSLIVSVFTEQFGLQSYLIKGVRSARSRTKRANMLQPAAPLDMVVYHQQNKNLQYVREFDPWFFYRNLHDDILKNSVAVFAVEVLSKLLQRDDPQPELFHKSIDFLKALDESASGQFANYPLFFLMHTCADAGYRISGNYCADTPYLDLTEGRFSSELPAFPPFIGDREARSVSRINQIRSLAEMQQYKLTTQERQEMLRLLLTFFALHIPSFKSFKSLAVLTAILHE